jgi:hypothetical protein
MSTTVVQLFGGGGSCLEQQRRDSRGCGGLRSPRPARERTFAWLRLHDLMGGMTIVAVGLFWDRSWSLGSPSGLATSKSCSSAASSRSNQCRTSTCTAAGKNRGERLRRFWRGIPAKASSFAAAASLLERHGWITIDLDFQIGCWRHFRFCFPS